MIGQTISHYLITARLGAGGMGEVYLAQDTRLDRKVALKLLPAELTINELAKKHLVREARAAAKLDHPNICSIYDVVEADGQTFIVMQYVEGKTLAGIIQGEPMAIDEALRIAIQIAEALAEAHSRGIIHRDIKPQNIIITLSRQAKLLDFGIAKTISDNSFTDTDALTLSAPTESGVIKGTVPYMSPEQVRGEGVDARSDTFAFGSVMYEMISGRQPFAAESAPAILAAILTQEPPPLTRYTNDVSEELQRIVSKCLEKDRERRYQTMRDAVVDLENCRRAPQLARKTASQDDQRTKSETAISKIQRPRSRLAVVGIGAVVLLVGLALVYLFVLRKSTITGGHPEIRSLAVLPLENLSGDQAQEYFAEGMTEALTAELSKIGALRVISRTSAMQYKGTEKLMTQVAKELNVDGVIEGSIIRDGDRVRITVQLIHGPTDNHVWAESYERELRGVLSLQSTVARAIANEVRVKLSAQESELLAGTRRVDPEAHDNYLRGRFYWNKGEREDLEKSREYFEQALQKDPRYAPAYAGLADYYSALPFYTNANPDEVFPKAREAVAKALEIDSSLPEAHGTLAYILTYYDWNWSEGEKEFQKSLALNPNDATQRHRYSRYLASLGRIEEALTELERARLLDPLDLVIKLNVGIIYYFARRSDEAIEQFQILLRDNPDFRSARWGLGLAYEQKGSYRQALPELEVAGQGKVPNALASLAHLYGLLGKKQQAREILTQLKTRAREENISGYLFALIHLGLGETEAAMGELQRAYKEHATVLSYIKADPRFDLLRNEPEFRELLSKIGLGQ